MDKKILYILYKTNAIKSEFVFLASDMQGKFPSPIIISFLRGVSLDLNKLDMDIVLMYIQGYVCIRFYRRYPFPLIIGVSSLPSPP